jgi:predicted nucleotidyltransferase
MDIRSRAKYSSLTALFPSLAMARLVIFFIVHPGGRFHVRELQRRTRLSSASLQKELRRMWAVGALRCERERGRTAYLAEEENRCWYAWMLLLRFSADPIDVLAEALVDVPGLEEAFVFGSFGRREAEEHSDLDLFLIGAPEERKRAKEILVDTGLILPRPLDVIGRDRDEFRAGSEAGAGFLRRVATQPRQWVVGGPLREAA